MDRNIVLEPSNEPFPRLLSPTGRPPSWPDSAFQIGTNEIALLLGELVVSTPEKSFSVLTLYGKELLRLTITDDRRVRLWIDVWDDDGRLLATIEDSVLRINKNNTLPVLRPNPHTLIIQNERKIEVLKLRFLNPRTLRLSGIFKAGGKYPVIIGDDEISFGPLIVSGGMALHLRGKSLFEWPGTLTNRLYFGSKDEIPIDGAQLGMAINDGAMNLILRTKNGEEFSLMQLGGKDVPEGTELWPAFSFRLKSPE